MTDAEIVAAEIRAAEVPMSDALGAALDRLERDAERYRYLRNRVPSEVLGGFGSAAGCWIDCEDDDRTLMLLTGHDADAAIDAAMLAASLRAA